MAAARLPDVGACAVALLISSTEGRAMKQGNLGALALVCLALQPLSTLARAENLSPLTLAPMQAVSLDVGVKHVVGYFLDGRDHCRLILAVADVGDDASASVSHVEFTVGDRAVARIESTPGGSISFTCDNEAHRMRVTRNDGLSEPESVD
jgi:hypothetical protein